MTMAEFIFWSPLWLAMLAAALYLVGYIGHHLVHRDNGHGIRHDAFMKNARAMGLTYQDAIGELYMREQLARIRREASDLVMREPADWIGAIAKAKNEAIERVAGDRPDLAPAFAGWLTGLHYGDVLYPAERRLVERQLIGSANVRPNDDQFAALRIAR